MRILVLTNWYPPHHRGGYELACRDVTERLKARGHDVVVLCSDQRMQDVTDDPGQRDVHRRLRMYFDDSEPVRPPKREQLEIERHNQAVLGEELEAFGPDVVFVWHMGALSLGLLTSVSQAGIPLVYSICDDWLTYGPVLDPWAGRFSGGRWRRMKGALVRFRRKVPTSLPDLGATGTFCFISRSVRDGAESSTPWDYPRSRVVFSGFDEELFDGPPSGQRQWTWRILYSGRFDPRKGIETLLRAMVPLVQARLTLDGRGSPSERAWVEELVANYGLSDRVVVRTSERGDLPARYRFADVVVFPSEWPEPFGLVPVEAMACGTPVIATGTGGSGEYLQDGVNCLQYVPGDHMELAQSLRRLAEDAGLRERLVDRGLRTARFLSADALTDALEECLEAELAGSDVPADRVIPDLAVADRPAGG